MSIPVIDLKSTGLNIVKLQNTCEVSTRQLQDILGFNTPNAIYKWRRGESLPTLDNLVILTSVFGVSMEDIVAVKGV